MLPAWKRSVSVFRRNIKQHRLTVSVLDPERISDTMLDTPLFGLHGTGQFALAREEYMACFNRLIKLDKQCENLSVLIRDDLVPNMQVYVKEDTGAAMIKTDAPVTGFITAEKNMVYAFWDYLEGQR